VTSRGAYLGYGFLALPLAFGSLPIYIHAPDWYATQWQVPLAHLGILLLLVRIIDALQDPWFGSLSDAYAEHRLSAIFIGLGAMALGFAGIFYPVLDPPILNLGLCLLVCTSGYSLASINYQALAGLLPVPSPSLITSWREALALLGLLCASVSPSLLTATLGKTQGFIALIALFFVLLGGASWVFYRWYQKHKQQLLRPHTTSAMGWGDICRSPWMRRLLLGNFFSALASSIPGVLVLFFIRDHLNAEAQAGVFLLLYFTAGALSMLLWQWAAKRLGLLPAWCAAMLLAVVSFSGAVFLAPGDLVLFALICCASGMALGADLSLPPALLAQHIQTQGHTTAVNRYFSLWLFTNKSALALATGVCLPLLAAWGYVPGSAPAASTYIAGFSPLVILYAAVPCLIKCLVVLYFYRHRHQLDSDKPSAPPLP
jgi:glycoside/pentoside/hexuronide:cation symporter, GPH family